MQHEVFGLKPARMEGGPGRETSNRTEEGTDQQDDSEPAAQQREDKEMTEF